MRGNNSMALNADVRQIASPISDETVRMNALNAALNITGRTNAATTTQEVLDCAEKIAAWIRAGGGDS